MTRLFSPALLVRLGCIMLMLSLFGCKSTKNDPTIKLPVVGAATVADITTTTARATSRLSDVGAGVTGVPTIKEYGICFGTKENPTIADTRITSGNATTAAADITAALTGLTPATAYFVRGFATHDGGTVYGDQATFTTGNLKAPTVNSGDGFDITRSGFSVVADLVTIGTSDVTQYGHVMSETNQQPTLADTKTELGAANAPKAYRSSFASLKQNTTYYVRAYATNAAGTGYGNAVTVKTLNVAAPTVTTGNISNIAYTSAQAVATLVTVGTNTNIQLGICWSKDNQNPTVNDSKTSGGANTPQGFTLSMTNLTPGITYYVRAFATSNDGTGYGDVKAFTTLTGTTPTVETGTPSTVSLLYAYVDGVKLLTLGTAPVTQFGLCWSSTNQNPTPADSKDERGSTPNPTYFIASMTNLMAGTTYYYRAYATNSIGTGYGAVKTITTRAYTPPVFSTNSVQWTSSSMEIVFKFAVGADVDRINTYGVVENNSTDKNMPDPAIENVNSFFYKAQRDISTTERSSLNANGSLTLDLFVRKGGTVDNPTGFDSGLTITNGNSTKAIYKKLRAYVIGASGVIYYAPVLKNF